MDFKQIGDVANNVIKFPERKQEEMSVIEAAEILKHHNIWRRYEGCSFDDNAPEMANPKELGIAIDIIVKYFEYEI